MVNHRLDKQDAELRLSQFAVLTSVLGSNWLTQEYSKPIEQWSLISGWISRSDDEIFGDQFEKWLKDLDAALDVLKKPHLSTTVWQKLERKVRAHSDRAGFKGTLSEIAMYRFLTSKKFPFDLEIRLNSQSSKDVDVRVTMPGSIMLHIEVQWLSPSKSSERGAAIASAYGKGYPLDYHEEKLRVKYKVHDKTSKFTVDDITLVALDCTSSPELGGEDGHSVVEEAIYEACTGRSWQGVPTGFGNSAVDTAIRKFVDGVIWFELIPGNGLLPHKRGMYLNPASPHRGKIEGSTFAQAWRDCNEGQ